MINVTDIIKFRFEESHPLVGGLYTQNIIGKEVQKKVAAPVLGTTDPIWYLIREAFYEVRR